jgi:hypothetical protein
MNLDLHVEIIECLANCARNNPYGIIAIRKLVDLEALMDALLTHSVPYLIKRSYFNLFYNGFVQQVGDLEIIDIS